MEWVNSSGGVELMLNKRHAWHSSDIIVKQRIIKGINVAKGRSYYSLLLFIVFFRICSIILGGFVIFIAGIWFISLFLLRFCSLLNGECSDFDFFSVCYAWMLLPVWFAILAGLLVEFLNTLLCLALWTKTWCSSCCSCQD